MRLIRVPIHVLRYIAEAMGDLPVRKYRVVDGYGIRLEGEPREGPLTDKQIRSCLVGEKEETWFIEADSVQEAKAKLAEFEGFKVGALEIGEGQPEIIDCDRLYSTDREYMCACCPEYPEAHQPCMFEGADPPEDCPYATAYGRDAPWRSRRRSVYP